MPISKKPRKKAAAKKKSEMANVIRFAPKAPAFEGLMKGFGGRPVDQAQDVMYEAWECGESTAVNSWYRRRQRSG